MIWYDICYDMIYLLTAIGLKPGGSSTVNIYTQIIHRTTQLTTLVGRLSGIRNQTGQTKINDELTALKLSPNCLPISDTTHHTFNNSKFITKSVHIRWSFGGGPPKLCRIRTEFENFRFIRFMVHIWYLFDRTPSI